jgi:hypothetical protein
MPIKHTYLSKKKKNKQTYLVRAACTEEDKETEILPSVQVHIGPSAQK